jgi:hypothetical protein
MKLCGRKADLGFCNLYGTPYLKFLVKCRLPYAHTGPHRASEPVNLAPTREGGDPVTKVTAEPVEITWEG